MPFFSIITATLNNGDTLSENIESVISQSNQNIEHIVIDGGSVDITLKILKQYKNRYPLYWISEPDDGIADALNKGLRFAKGQYIIILQADDLFLNPEVLSMVYANIYKSNKDICSFPVFLDHPIQGRMLRKPIRQLWYNRFKFIFPHQGCFVKRSVFDQIGGFNTSFKIAMDYDFFYRALQHGCTVTFCHKPVALMGCNGIGTLAENATYRFKEEQRVQAINEDKYFWRKAQRLFWIVYLHYKKWHSNEYQ
jgi:glycosyltransferase involved in cell wall biosynthesis